MQKMSVTYTLCDDDIARLNRIVNEYKSQGIDTSPESVFSFIMTIGCCDDIDKRLSSFEHIMGIS